MVFCTGEGKNFRQFEDQNLEHVDVEQSHTLLVKLDSPIPATQKIGWHLLGCLNGKGFVAASSFEQTLQSIQKLSTMCYCSFIMIKLAIHQESEAGLLDS